MRKFKKIGLVAVLSMVIMLFTGCYHAMVTSEVEIYNLEGGGKKTYIAEILNNNNDVPKSAWNDKEGAKPYTPGNNFSRPEEGGTLKVVGADLQAKVKAHCTLPSAIVSVYEAKASVANTLKEGETTLPETPSTYIKIEFTFTDIADYNAKMKTLAGKYSSKIVDATIEIVEGKLKFTEEVSNSAYGIAEILEKIYADTTIFDVVIAGGKDQVAPYSKAGFLDDDGYVISGGFAPYAMAQLKSVTVKVGDEVYTEKLVDMEDRETIYPENSLTATGTPKAPVEKEEERSGCGSAAGAAASIIGALGLIAFGIKKKLKSK